jgi:hypothetical protein
MGGEKAGLAQGRNQTDGVRGKESNNALKGSNWEGRKQGR